MTGVDVARLRQVAERAHDCGALLDLTADEALALLDRLEVAEAAVGRLRGLAQQGYYLSRPYGDPCETCGTKWQESGLSLRVIIGEATP